MKYFNSPFWYLPLCFLPYILIGCWFISVYEIIEGFIEKSEQVLWLKFGISLCLLTIISGIGFTISLKTKTNGSVLWNFFLLVLNFVFLTSAFLSLSNLFPSSIPNWVISEAPILHLVSFLMIPLGFHCFNLVQLSIDVPTSEKLLMTFIWGIIISGLGYLGIMVFIPRQFHPFENLLQIYFSIYVLVLVFFLFRFMYLFVQLYVIKRLDDSLVVKLIFSLVLPIFCVLINRINMEMGIFGDFWGVTFFLLLGLNALFVCLPTGTNPIFQWFVMLGRALFFPFTFYFLLVFLPFLPISFFLVFFFLSGLLLLVPTILFLIHSLELFHSFHALKERISGFWISLILFSSFTVLPLLWYANARYDKMVLHQGLEYFFNPNYEKSYQFDLVRFKKSLDEMESNKRGFFGIWGERLPFLSSLYNWTVLDNLTLSNSKIDRLNQFIKGDRIERISNPTNSSHYNVSGVSQTRYDSLNQCYISTIDLEIFAPKINFNQTEFTAQFAIPIDAYVKQYYLVIEGKKVPGILAEKKSALWLYNNIVNYRRDPGVLYYASPTLLSLRIFPFTENEHRTSGFEIIHKQPFQLRLNDKIFSLGEIPGKSDSILENKAFMYIPSTVKSSLEIGNRSPYLHFILQCSSKTGIDSQLVKFKEVSAKYPQYLSNAKVSLVNAFCKTIPYVSLEKNLNSMDLGEGFNLDMALKYNFYNQLNAASESYPMYVFDEGLIEKAVLENSYSPWEMAFPESKYLYGVNDNGTFQVHSLLNFQDTSFGNQNGFLPAASSLVLNTKEGIKINLPKDEKSSIVIKAKSIQDFDGIKSNTVWEEGLVQKALNQFGVLHPEQLEQIQDKMIERSFKSHLLNPFTCFMSVENPAFLKVLEKKQIDVLEGKNYLDAGNDPLGMSEPNKLAILFFAGILLAVGIFKYKKHKGIGSRIKKSPKN